MDEDESIGHRASVGDDGRPALGVAVPTLANYAYKRHKEEGHNKDRRLAPSCCVGRTLLLQPNRLATTPILR